ncbi:hypothetical protein [Paenibacillus sp. BT-177]|uniref:hypothetical protein n=1 Tax=Paenibacillus sp. BT-177 TaxID=2986930 RepID=UPI0021F77F06|nr:hypothetical protein [Paenibacillus sp. BT-177]
MIFRTRLLASFMEDSKARLTETANRPRRRSLFAVRCRNGEDEEKSQHTISARFAPWPSAKDEQDQSLGFPATI